MYPIFEIFVNDNTIETHFAPCVGFCSRYTGLPLVISAFPCKLVPNFESRKFSTYLQSNLCMFVGKPLFVTVSQVVLIL